MISYAIRRIAGALVVIFLVSFLTFSLLQMAQGDAVLAIAPARHGDAVALTPEIRERFMGEIGANEPVLVQRGRWVSQLARFDLGVSLIDRRPVADILAEGFGRTLQLALAAILIVVVLSIPLGLFAGVWRGSWFDSLCVGLASLGSAMPNWWLGVLLIVVFSVNLGWLPAFGRGDAAHLALPALALCTGITVTTARLSRSAIIEAMSARHIAAARGRGIRQSRIIGRHALRNVLVPVITVFALEIAFVLEGALAVAYVLGWRGLGLIFIEAADARDYPVIQAIVLFSAILFVVINLVVDLLTALLDPRTTTGIARRRSIRCSVLQLLSPRLCLCLLRSDRRSRPTIRLFLTLSPDCSHPVLRVGSEPIIWGATFFVACRKVRGTLSVLPCSWS